MRISAEQERIIDSLYCERLASNDDNLRQVDGFYCRRNESLGSVLQNEAFEDDECGSTAYYIVKDRKGRILFYFSLKTGLLYDQHIDEKSIKIFKKLNDFVKDVISQHDLTENQVRALMGFLEKVRTHKGVTKEDLERLPQRNQTLFEELEAELNHNITHVGKTYSGVELVHFCKNNTDFLHFKTDDARATVKPVYDFACKFMYQPTSELEVAANAFWDNFNDDEV